MLQTHFWYYILANTNSLVLHRRVEWLCSYVNDHLSGQGVCRVFPCLQSHPQCQVSSSKKADKGLACLPHLAV